MLWRLRLQDIVARISSAPSHAIKCHSLHSSAHQQLVLTAQDHPPGGSVSNGRHEYILLDGPVWHVKMRGDSLCLQRTEASNAIRNPALLPLAFSVRNRNNWTQLRSEQCASKKSWSMTSLTRHPGWLNLGTLWLVVGISRGKRKVEINMWGEANSHTEQLEKN